MPDNEITITTRYTDEGYDALLNKAANLGERLRYIGRDLERAGRALGITFLTDIGNAIDGVQSLARSLSDVKGILQEFPKLGLGLSALGGAFVGSKIYDATIGQLQGTSTQQIFDQLGTLFKYGFNQEAIIRDLRIDATNAQIDVARADLQLRIAAQKNDPTLNKTFAASYDILAALPGFGAASNAAKLADIYRSVAAEQDAAAEAAAKLAEESRRLSAALTEAEKRNERVNRFMSEYSKIDEARQRAAADSRERYVKIENDIKTARLAAAQSLADDLKRLEEQYYSSRLKIVENAGIEEQRAEEDHQRRLRDLAKQRDKDVRRAAEQRDALALEDALASYEEQRQTEEENNDIAARRRNEDNARQLRDLDRAFTEQRDARVRAYNEMLAELQTRHTTELSLTKQYFDAIEADLKRRLAELTAAPGGSNTPGPLMGGREAVGSKSLTANTTINGSGLSSEQLQQAVYTAITRVFEAAL